MIFWRNLLRARVRSLMTVLGIAAGVGLFAAATAITTDLRQQIAAAIGEYRFDVVIHEKRAPSPFSSRLTPAQMQALEARFGAALTPLVMGTLNEAWSAYAMVLGVPPAFAQRVPLTAGQHFAPGRAEVTLGEIAAQRLGLGVGQSVSIGGSAWRIAGIYRTGSRLFDGGMMGDLPAVQRLFAPDGAEPHYTLALLATPDRAGTDRAIAAVAASYPALRAIPGTEFAGAIRLFRVVEAFVGTIALVVLLGSALVVTNMLMMAVAERTREIGILMAVGWTPWLVLRMLAAESLLLCALGTALGNLFGLGLLHAVNRLETVGFGWLPLRLSAAQVLDSALLIAAVGLVSLAWPAAVLWRMQPLEALRHE
ncbi:MAG: ABC transporter permease [Burkholderiaceae bacterium]|nr:ABC transporter permease [Burkholderiaceae bacterium]